jgi:BirA family transcriptional regulator, biotin operon repressor / biotin---[acetyl-CoA-carboxylase] ligase
LKVIKLSAIASTNSYLKEMVVNGLAEDELVITATHQQEGRGQHGASWQSQAGKSLACSLFKRFNDFLVTDQFALNMVVSLGVLEALQKLGIPKVAIKWPNDIMSHGRKLAGVLVENQIKGKEISSSIIGIGLNVNETSFENLPQATSLVLVTGNVFTIEEVLQQVAKTIFERLKTIQAVDFETTRNLYHEKLFRKDIVSTFETPEGKIKNGIINGVSREGKLLITHDGDTRIAYDLKEIKMLF